MPEDDDYRYYNNYDIDHDNNISNMSQSLHDYSFLFKPMCVRIREQSASSAISASLLRALLAFDPAGPGL